MMWYCDPWYDIDWPLWVRTSDIAYAYAEAQGREYADVLPGVRLITAGRMTMDTLEDERRRIRGLRRIRYYDMGV